MRHPDGPTFRVAADGVMVECVPLSAQYTENLWHLRRVLPGLVVTVLLASCATYEDAYCPDGLALRSDRGALVCEGFGSGTNWRRVAPTGAPFALAARPAQRAVRQGTGAAQ
jgi:hypothetical protein